jgi:hypothetical protein
MKTGSSPDANSNVVILSSRSALATTSTSESRARYAAPCFPYCSERSRLSPHCEDLRCHNATIALQNTNRGPMLILTRWLRSTQTLFLLASPMFLPPLLARTCQDITDTYAVVAGKGFGFAPEDARVEWRNNNCSTNPSNNKIPALCQEMSNRFAINAGVT